MPQKMIEEFFAKRLRTSLGKIRSHRQDLNFEQLKIYYEAAGLKLGDQFLQNLELFTDEGYLIYAAYLLADVNNNSIKVAKYQGIDRNILIENNEYGYCCLVKSTNQVLDKLELENVTSVVLTSKRRKEKRLWDSIALREAVINAVIHNDYVNEVPPKFEIFDDRIEITSAGGLPDALSEDEFFLGVSIPRNKELMRVFKDLGFVEQLGSGVPRMLKSYGRECFHFMPNFLRSAFAKNIPENQAKNGLVDGLVDGLVESQRKIIELMLENPKITKKVLAEKTRISTTAVDKNLKTLKSRGFITRIGSDRHGYWKVLPQRNIQFQTDEDV